MSYSENNQYNIKYPRKRFARGMARVLGRLFLPALFQLDISGENNYPKSGPLLVVANHTAVMESVMLAVFPPWQIELIGSVDVPHEKLTEVVSNFFGFIPIHRGRMERNSLKTALDVLKQRGILGIYPEGGIWDAGAMRAHSGVAWLSYRSGAPILPIGFGDTTGALGAAFKFRRPRLTMRIGEIIPAARLQKGKPRKVYFQEFATRVMAAVRALLPWDDLANRIKINDERFELEVVALGKNDNPQEHPPDLTIEHTEALAKLLHRPAILKIFRNNLELPIQAIQDLNATRDPTEIVSAIQPMLNYLETENPYLLVYRFGPKEAEAMQLGLKELLALAQWAADSGKSLSIIHTRRYFRSDQEGEIVETKQGKFEDWM